MKRVKPGRAPSAMGAAMSAVIAVFGVFWTIAALSIGAPVFFALFGVVFVVMAIVQAVYNYKNATGKERFSVMDIVDDDEEGDPTDRWVCGGVDADESVSERKADEKSAADVTANAEVEAEVNFCPYCGAKAEKTFRFCRKCGKRIR